MKQMFVTTAICILHITAFAQLKAKTVLYAPTEGGNDQVRITLSNGVAEKEFSKFKIQIQNRTGDFILFHAKESFLSYDFGQYNHNRDGKYIFAKPHESTSRTIEIKSDQDLRRESYQYTPKGLYLVSSEGTGTKADDVQLLPSLSEIKIGNFQIQVTELSKKTSETVIKCNVRYYGDKIGIVDPVKVKCRMPNGTEFSVYNINEKPNLLEKGFDDRFVLSYRISPAAGGSDMQKSDMFLVWKDCFRESEKVPLDIPAISVKISSTK